MVERNHNGRYKLTHSECDQHPGLSEREGTNTHFLLKNKNKNQNSLHTTPSRGKKAKVWNAHPQNIPRTPMNSIPQLLLDERNAYIWTTVRMPIVHFSVLLVFKKFATHNTEQFQIQCAVIQPSKLLPTPPPQKSWQSTAQEFHR